MLTQQFEHFYEKWYEKANGYIDNTLSDAFDKFITLYIIYNSLYVEVWNKLVLSDFKKVSKKNFRERIAATDYIIKYLKDTYYIDKLFCNEQSEKCLSTICQLIEQERFYIVFEVNNNGIRQPFPNKDKDLLNCLKSNSKNSRAKAILELIYNIRCNLIHGGKGFEEYQKELLFPVNYILEKTIEIMYDKLKNENILIN